MTEVDSITLQRSFWDEWNAHFGKETLCAVSKREADVVCGWLESLGRKDLEILEVGCGSGWFCSRLVRFGRVTGTDLCERGRERAQARAPEATFISGDFMGLEFGSNSFDVVVTLEVLSHVADQRAFIKKLASHLRPGGYLMMATQNRFVLKYLNRIPPPAPGQLRRWVNQRELRDLLEPEFEVSKLFSVTSRFARRTMARLKHSRAFGWGRGAADERDENGWTEAAEQVGRPALWHSWLTGRLEDIGLGWALMALARKRTAL